MHHITCPYTPNTDHALRSQNEEFECQVAEFHKSHAGQTPSDAEMNMLDKVKRLELYGVDLHLAMVSSWGIKKGRCNLEMGRMDR